MLVHLQTTWTFLPLARPELGEPNDALHVDGQGRLAPQVSNSGQALQEQMGAKLGYLLLFHQSDHLKPQEYKCTTSKTNKDAQA